MEAPESQDVLAPITEAAIFLVLTVNPGSESEVRDALTDVGGLTRSVGFRVPEAGLVCIAGISASGWDRLYKSPRPAGLHPFKALTGAKHSAVSTPGELLLHIRARRFDLCFELAQRMSDRLSGHARVVDEVHGFRSFDLRDVLGFVDGTENPSGNPAAQAVLIGDEDPDYRGGSYVIVQKYLHDMSSWDSQPVEEQERVIGRTKLSDIEMPDDVKPSNSHVALNTIVDDDGIQHQIVRFNMPFGRVGSSEYGTYFIGYARTPLVIEQMLHNMFIGKPEGNYDRILDFSTAVTGNLFFVPTVDFLESSGDVEDSVPNSVPQPAMDAASSDRSLNIGSLKSEPI